MNLNRKIVLFDAAASCLLAMVLFPLLAQPAYAYVDPSVMTYTIQALAGVAVALSALFGVVFRKTRRKVFELLGIDENAGKIVEPDVHRIVDGKVVGETVEAAPEASKRKRRRAARETSDAAARPLAWHSRIGYALLASFFLSCTVCISAPIEIVAANASSLVYGVSEVGWYIVAFGVAFAIVLALLLSCLRGRAFDIALLVVVSIGIASWVQAMFLNTSLPAADGSAVAWNDYTKITVFSAAAWAAIIAIPIIASKKHRGLLRRLSMVVAVALIIVQSVGVSSLFIGSASAHSAEQDKIYCTEDGINTLSSKNNVVVIVLDMFDTGDIKQVFAQDPDAVKTFDNFTFFENSTGSMIPTRYAIPFLLTGELPQDGESFDDYMASRYTKSTFLSDIQAKNYSIGIYTDSINTNYKNAVQSMYDTPEIRKVASRTINMHSIGKPNVDPVGSVQILLKCALYRDAPWVAKPRFWYFTDEVNSSMVNQSSNEDYANTEYTMNDVGYYNDLKSNGLSLQSESYAGAFRFIHLMGAHWPYIMNENCENVPDGEGSYIQQEEGAIKIVGEYLQKMKDLGVYDNSTIIVTADHGYWYATMDKFLVGPTSPIMLVKPAGSSDDATPMAISDMPISHIDVQPTVIAAIGGDASKYGEGKTFFQINDLNRTRYYYMTTHSGEEGRIDHEIVQYQIQGDAEDFDNWKTTGKEWVVTPRDK